MSFTFYSWTFSGGPFC